MIESVECPQFLAHSIQVFTFWYKSWCFDNTVLIDFDFLEVKRIEEESRIRNISPGIFRAQ